MIVALFGEAPGGFVVSGATRALRGLAEQVPLMSLGRVGEDAFSIVEAGARAEMMLTLSLAELAGAHSSLAKLLA